MKKRERTPAARERIVRSALDIAGREGIEALTTRRVAEEAAVNLGLIHYYFGSKEELVREALLLFVAEQGDILAGAPPGEADGDPAERLAELFCLILERAMARPALVFSLVRLISEQMSHNASSKPGSPDRGLEGAPVGPMLRILRPVVARLEEALASRLGGERDLVSRRALQVFTSLLHPILFSPLPGPVFGCGLSTRKGREAYVRGIVEDALRPPGPAKADRGKPASVAPNKNRRD